MQGLANCDWRKAQSKWGRHCCRPHSHRRVVALSRVPFGEPPVPRSRARLAPDVSPTPKYRVLSPALAPASDHCLRTTSASWSTSPHFAAVAPRAEPRPFPFSPNPSNRHSWLAPFLPSRFGPIHGLPMDELRDLLKRSDLLSAEASCMPSLKVRVDNFHRVEIS